MPQALRVSVREPRARLSARANPTTPPLPYRGKALPSPLAGIDGGATLLPAWAVPAGKDAWLLRLHEVAGRCGVCTLTPADGWAACTADFDGTPHSGPCAVAFTPYQILTVRFTHSPSRK